MIHFIHDQQKMAADTRYLRSHCTTFRRRTTAAVLYDDHIVRILLVLTYLSHFRIRP